MADRRITSAAVIVESACKHYGPKVNRKVVLDHLNMTVEKGAIYGLLGASGCGKTTLLSCIVGRRRLNSGDIWVLGGKPGTRGSGVPGPRIGYMPQDIALVGEFTVKDAVFYFGRIFGMNAKHMSERFDFLSTLLDLPPEDRLVKNLSGGQQRRVSFAAALVQSPELLILDEPTVGLDPLLRERIWDYLVTLSNNGTTVIITTHYIDETKQATKIGLLRGGSLLAEESPANLLARCGARSLEEAFLALAMKQTAGTGTEYQNQSNHQSQQRLEPIQLEPISPAESTQNCNNYNSKEDFGKMCNTSTEYLSMKDTSSSSSLRSLKGTAKGRYKAIFIKNMQQFGRHPGGLLFALFFPIIQTIAFFSAIGHNPRGLQVAVVNNEEKYSMYGDMACSNKTIQEMVYIDDERCELQLLSCRLVELMEQSDIKPVKYPDLDRALDTIRTGKHYMAIYFAEDFTELLQERFRDATGLTPDQVNRSSALVWLDMTNHQISHYLRQELYKVYEEFSRSVMRDCGFTEELAMIPVHFETPIHGEKNPNYSVYMAPGILMTIIFFMAATITSTIMISDRLEGVWERSAVAGVKAHEVLVVHIAVQGTVVLVQTIEMMLLAFLGYGLTSKGDLSLVFLMLFLQGLAGMCYGFLLSITCSSYTLAFFISTGSFYPMILLCGIMWPIEGMSRGLRMIAKALPFTLPSAALRDIMSRGQGLTQVTPGFLLALGWIVATVLLCIAALRLRRA